MDDRPDPVVVDYIRSARERFTREAITSRLLEIGRSEPEIERAWQVVDAEPRPDPAPGWRPGWMAWLVLVVGGAIGSYLVWRDEPYGAGGISVFVYVFAASTAYAVGKGASMLIDGGHRIAAAAVMGLVVGALTFLVVADTTGALVAAATVAAFAFGLPTLALGSSDPRVAGYIGAAFPLIAWLAVTGVCYSPLF